MTFPRRAFLAGVATLALAACARTKFRRYNGPEVTRVVVFKSRRKMFLFHGRDVLKSYDFHLGFAPVGDKKVEGDGKTPEGVYFIDRKNPNSSFHLSLGINYPNAADLEEAKALGKPAGSDIFIHGDRRPLDGKGPDWTAGCIAVTNREIEEIYAMVNIGTRIDILP